MFIFAAETDGLPAWAQVLLGIALFIGVITKQLVPGWMYQDLKAENQQLRQDVKDGVKRELETQPKVIAAMEAHSKTLDDAMTEIRLLRRERDDPR